MCSNNELFAVHTEIIAKTTELLIDTYDYMKHNALQNVVLYDVLCKLLLLKHVKLSFHYII